MPTPAYLSLIGTKQGFITEGNFSQDSVGNVYQEGHEDQILVQAFSHQVIIPRDPQSGQPLLVSGHFLALSQHPKAKWNDLWLLTEILHEGKQPQVLEESVTSDTSDLKDDFHQGYRNRFQATPWDVPNRPPLVHPKKGQEQIFLHAQRDWDENIEHDQKIRVGNERHDTVEANSYSKFKAEEHHTVHKDRKVETRANDHLTVGVNQHIKIGTGQFIEAGQEIHLSSGLKVVLEAGSELTLKGGGSFIKIDAGGVTLSGPVINMNSGGSPGGGTGAAPILPGPLKQADADKAGMPIEALVKQNIVFRQARAGVCEVCEAAKAAKGAPK